jgi:hypothetical protein
MKTAANAIQLSYIDAFQPLFWSGMMVASTGSAFGLQQVPAEMLRHSIAAWPVAAGTFSSPPQIAGLALQFAPNFALPPAERASAAGELPAIASGPSAIPKQLIPLEPARANPGYVLRIVLPTPTKAEATDEAAVLPGVMQPSAQGEGGEPAVQETTAQANGIPQPPAPGIVPDGGDQPPVVPSESAPPEMPALVGGPSLLPTSFDLAQLAAGREDRVRDIAAKPKANSGSIGETTRLARAGASAGAKRDRIVDGAVAHTVAVSINGDDAGQIEVRIRDDHTPEVRVSDVLALVQGMMAPDAYGALRGSASALEFVTFNQIRNAGIDVRYMAGTDTIALSAS